jgi:hypothetical protein
LEGFDELVAIHLTPERISNTINQMIKLLSDGFGGDRIPVNDGAHDENVTSCEQTATS